MTMLDRMRRHKNWLKWSLAIVVVAFVALYIPSFMESPSLDGASPYGVVATVEGRDITVARFRRVYQQQMQAYRNAYGGSMDERLLRQLGVDQRIVQQLIEEEAALAEAQPAGNHGHRHRSASTDPGAPCLPGERALHRQRSLSAASPDAEPAD